MLSLLSPCVVALIQLLTAPEPPTPRARVEQIAIGADARRLAAGVLIDADAFVDVALTDDAAMFEVELAGERHELRLELDADGAVIGAAVWWLGAGEAEPRDDLALALPVLERAGTLDAITVDDGGVWLIAGGVSVLISDHEYGC